MSPDLEDIVPGPESFAAAVARSRQAPVKHRLSPQPVNLMFSCLSCGESIRTTTRYEDWEPGGYGGGWQTSKFTGYDLNQDAYFVRIANLNVLRDPIVKPIDAELRREKAALQTRLTEEIPSPDYRKIVSERKTPQLVAKFEKDKEFVSNQLQQLGHYLDRETCAVQKSCGDYAIAAASKTRQSEWLRDTTIEASFKPRTFRKHFTHLMTRLEDSLWPIRLGENVKVQFRHFSEYSR